MQPGEYFAINVSGEAHAVVAHITALGYPVTAAQMSDLAASVGETTIFDLGASGGRFSS